MSQIIKAEPHEVAPAQSDSAALISLIQRAASDPNVDIEKMERLFAMHQAMQERAARAAYNAAMSQAQAEMPAVVRNKQNTHSGAKYADLYAIADAALPTINRHGFGLSFFECEATRDGCMGVAVRVSHSAGHDEVYKFNVPLDKAGSQGKVNKTDTQAYGSTYTYGRRYATVGVFNIPITDKDGNASHETITDEQAEDLAAKLDAAGVEIPAFCAFFKIEKYADLPAAQYSRALKMIEQAKAKRTTK